MSKSRFGQIVLFVIILSTAVYGCGLAGDLDGKVEEIAGPYRFDLAGWEIRELAGEIGEELRWPDDEEADTIKEIVDYFTNAAEIRYLEARLGAVRAGNLEGDTVQLEKEIEELQEKNAERREAAEEAIEIQVREALTEQGIYNPLDRRIEMRVGFPPVKVHLGSPPHILIVSPRDRIERIMDIELLPEMSEEDMVAIEREVDKLGVSSLVEGLGGLSTYPSFVNDRFGLRFAVQTAVHEWMHQYLFFTPLGMRYLLDQTNIRPDDEIATINETVADIVGREIGDIIYKKCAPGEPESAPPPSNGNGFDFNKTMRETRLAVDAYLERGEVEQAETYMERQRQYLAENGYYIRKLNQAYFAFHGAYADSPASVSPIGGELRQLREESGSLGDFVKSVASIKSREALAELVE